MPKPAPPPRHPKRKSKARAKPPRKSSRPKNPASRTTKRRQPLLPFSSFAMRRVLRGLEASADPHVRVSLLEGLIWEHVQMVLGMSLASGANVPELVIALHVAFLRSVNGVPDVSEVPAMLRAGAQYHAQHYLHPEEA